MYFLYLKVFTNEIFLFCLWNFLIISFDSPLYIGFNTLEFDLEKEIGFFSKKSFWDLYFWLMRGYKLFVKT